MWPWDSDGWIHLHMCYLVLWSSGPSAVFRKTNKNTHPLVCAYLFILSQMSQQKHPSDIHCLLILPCTDRICIAFNPILALLGKKVGLCQGGTDANKILFISFTLQPCHIRDPSCTVNQRDFNGEVVSFSLSPLLVNCHWQDLNGNRWEDGVKDFCSVLFPGWLGWR